MRHPNVDQAAALLLAVNRAADFAFPSSLAAIECAAAADALLAAGADPRPLWLDPTEVGGAVEQALRLLRDLPVDALSTQVLDAIEWADSAARLLAAG